MTYLFNHKQIGDTMKKMILLLALVLVIALGKAYSQGWTKVGNFPNDSFMGSTGGHGVAVDPDGKVWCMFYGNTDSVFVASTSSWKACRAVYVFNADGTPASFSPIKTITVSGVTDTLYNSNRGLRADNNGNILVSSYDVLYRINYQTGNGMAKVQPVAGMTLTAAAVDVAGNVFTAPVIPGNPIGVYTTDFSFIGNAVVASIGYSRTLEVSNNGNTIYWTGYTNNKVYVYSRPDEFSPFELKDSVLFGFACESISWQPNRKLLWASSGSGLTLPNADPDHVTYWDNATWYAWNPLTNTIVDSIKWVFNTPGSPDERPRGIAFSPNGRFAYITCFGGSTYPAFQKFENPNWTSVDEEGQVVLNGYKLSQNYPNPFNPSTRISFELPNSGLVILKVYDMLGREVAVLVDEELTSGSHSVNFNAANLASGTYIYQLNVNGTRITNKMVLLK